MVFGNGNATFSWEDLSLFFSSISESLAITKQASTNVRLGPSSSSTKVKIARLNHSAIHKS